METCETLKDVGQGGRRRWAVMSHSKAAAASPGTGAGGGAGPGAGRSWGSGAEDLGAEVACGSHSRGSCGWGWEDQKVVRGTLGGDVQNLFPLPPGPPH